MAAKVSFKSEIKSLTSELAKAEEELSSLREQRATYQSEVQQLRNSLDDLKAALNGEVRPPKSVRKLRPVARKEGSDRPKRGARKTQIKNICRALGRGGNEFRTAEVLEELRRIENDVTDGIRSYTYAVMNSLQEEDFVEKVGRGTWAIK